MTRRLHVLRFASYRAGASYFDPTFNSIFLPMAFEDNSGARAHTNRFGGALRRQIRAVAFDAVGTVMYPEPSVADAYRNAIRRHCGLEVSQEVVSTTVKDALIERSAAGDLRTDENAENRFWATLIRQLCPDSTGFQACFDDLFSHFADAKNWKCFPDTGSCVSQLQQAGLTCAVASNFDRRLNSVCDGLPDLTTVHHRIVSSVVGWRKPATQFFAAMADTLQLRPDEILMVGDDLTNDVAGAIAAGMPAAWICRDDSQNAQLAPGAFRVSSLTELVHALTPAGSASEHEATEQSSG